MGLKIQLLQGDTPVEQGAAPALTLAQKYAADPKVVGIIGPSTSGDAEASAQTYFQAGIAQISPSATDTPLTYTVAGKKLGTPAFFRDVPANNVEGPTIATYIAGHPEGEERCRLRLPGAVLAGPRRHGQRRT